MSVCFRANELAAISKCEICGDFDLSSRTLKFSHSLVKMLIMNASRSPQIDAKSQFPSNAGLLYLFIAHHANGIDLSVDDDFRHFLMHSQVGTSEWHNLEGIV